MQEDWNGRRRTLRDIRTRDYAETQADFAARLEVSEVALNGWETGRARPQMRLRHQVAGLLGLSVSQIEWDVPRRTRRKRIA